MPYQRGASGPRWKTYGLDGLGIEASSPSRTYRYRPGREAARAAETSLRDRVAVVAGGTRGAGRGIAIALGERGAIVYVTGRSTAAGRSELGRGETIEETAALVSAAGGQGI